MASKSHASVADLASKLQSNIESIKATLSLLVSTSSAHSAELDRLQNEREAKIHELRTAHAIALQELAEQRKKDEEALAEQRRQEQEELEAQRQREYEELMARRKQEDEERERLLKEKEAERIRLMQEEDAKREAESEEMERSLQEKIERELEELEDEMERKVEEGRQALRTLNERRRAINAEFDEALNIPTVIPTVHFRSRAKRLGLASKGLTNGNGNTNGNVNGDVHVNGNVNGNGNYAVASPSLNPVVDKAISDVDTEEESEHKNVEAPSSENDSVVNGSRDIIKEEVKPTPAPEVEETPAVPETESTPVEPAAVEEQKDLLEEKVEEAAAVLPVAVVEAKKEISESGADLPAQPAHESEEITENKDISHDDTEPSHIEAPSEPENDLPAGHEALPSVALEVEEAKEIAHSEPEAPLEPAQGTEKSIENKEIGSGEPPLEPETVSTEHEASHSGEEHVEPLAAEIAESEPVVEHEGNPEAEKEIEATAEHDASHSDDQHVEPLAAEVEPTVESHEENPEPEKDVASTEHEIQPTSEATEQVEAPEAEETKAAQESEISEHQETPLPEQEQPEVHEHAEEIPVNESQEDSTQPEHPPFEHTTTVDETIPEPRGVDAEPEASPEHDPPASEEPTINADQEVLSPAPEAATAEDESPSHVHTAPIDVQSEELAEKEDEVPRDVGEVVDEREVDDGKEVLPPSEGERLDEPAVLGDAGVALVGGLSAEVAEEREKDDAHDEGDVEKSLDTPAQVDEAKDIAHESDATPLNASEHDNVEVNAEPNSTPVDGTDVIQENHIDEKIATVEPALEVLEAESEPADAVLPDHETTQEKELEESHDVEPSETAHEASESELKDPTTEIVHEDEHQEVDPTPAHIESEDESKESGLDVVHEQEHHEAPVDDVSNELPNETDHHDGAIPEIVQSEEQPKSHVEDSTQHETSQVSSEPVPGEDVVTRSISPVEEEAQLQDSAVEETPSTAVGEEHLLSEENPKEISTEPEHEVAVAEQEEAGDVPTIPAEHLNVPNEVEHSSSPADLGEEIEHPEHDNLEASATKEASEEVESEAVPHEASLPEDSRPTSLENEVDEEPVSHSEPAKDNSVHDLPAQENVSDEHLDEKELESTPAAADTHVVGEHESTKEIDDAVADASHENEQAPTIEAGHSDVPAVDEVASKEVQHEVAAEGDAVQTAIPDEEIAHSEAQVERSSTPALETEQPRDVESQDETHPISHEILSENHEQQDQDSDDTLTISAPPGEESPNRPSNALAMAEKEVPDWGTHGVFLHEGSDAYMEDSDKAFSDITTRDYNDMASAASATSEPSNPRLDVFRYLEPETTDTTDTNDTTEAEAYDTMDEDSLVDGAPLNGSTGPQEEDRISTPVQHPVVAVASHINRFAESPATVLNTDDLFDDDTDSVNSHSEEGDDADQEDDDDEDEDEETCDDSEDEDDSDEPVPEPAVPSKIERSFPHVVSHMPSYEFGKPKMVDPFSEGSHEQVDFSTSHRSSGLFASLVDTIKSDIPAVKQMADNGESSRSLMPDDNDEYHSLSDYSQGTPRAKEVPNAFQETDGEETPFHDTFSHHEAENLHNRSHTADTVPSFESFAQSDVESTPSETPSSPFQEIPKQEPRIESSWSLNDRGEEHGELKPEDSPLRAEFDPYGTKSYPKCITPKPSQANLRSPRSSRFPQSVDGAKAQYNRRDSVSSMSSNPSARRLRRTESNEAALSEARAQNSSPSRTPSLRNDLPGSPSPPTQQPTTTAANSSAKTTVPASLPSNSFFQKTRSLFESSALPAASPPSSITRPISGYFNVARGSSASPSPQLQRKGSMASLRSIPPPLEEEDALAPRSLDGDGKPPSLAFTIPRRDSTTSQRKSSHGSISRVENDLTPFIPSKNIRPKSSNPFFGLARTLGGERGLEDSIHNPERERALQHQPLLSGDRRDSWGDGGASLGNVNRS